MKETFWNSKVKADILSNEFCDQLELNKIVLSMEELSYFDILKKGCRWWINSMPRDY